jgi:hypothetical protein
LPELKEKHMKTISTSKLSEIVGLHLPISFLKTIGLNPAMETKLGAMWNESDVNYIFLELGLHFLNKSDSHAVAPHGYKKNGHPSKKRGRPSRLSA